jgi:serine/threonine protein kinase
MSYCVTPGCANPQNPNTGQVCLSCGIPLLLDKRYRPIQPIGRGGFGRTFLAIDEKHPSKLRCVIKQLHVESQNTWTLKKAVELFHQEAERLHQLGNHPQIPALIGHFEENKRLYLVQEFIGGKTLEQELQQTGIFNEQQIWELLRDLVPVLKFIHDRRVIHRDIKPTNIMRHTSSISNNRQLVIIDFGVAKLITDSALFRTGTAVGSAEYVAPEQMRGKALPASDLYSLGATCIYLMTKVSPFNLFDITTNKWAWRDYLPKEISVSDRLGRILDKLLQSAISQRYKSADQLLQALTPTSPITSTATKLSQPPASHNFLTKLWRQAISKPAATKPQGDFLISEVGVDYRILQSLLSTGKWQQANEENWRVMCQAIGKASGRYLQASDIDKFPCQDLETIDRLWVKYSQGHFGFSVQKQIYESVDREYEQFCQLVGWPIYNLHVPDSSMNYSLRSPVGHLPSRNWVGGYEWWRHAEHLALRLEQCL